MFPASSDTTIFALASVARQVEAGSTHSPEERTRGLHIMTPSVTRTGGPQCGDPDSGSAFFIIHTPPTVALCPTACAQKTRREPSGAIHTSGSKARTGPSASGSMTVTSFQVLPSSPLVVTVT